VHSGEGFGQAQSLIEQASDAQVHDPIVDIHSGSTGLDDPETAESLKLVGNRLWLHADLIGQFRDTQLVGPHEGVQQPKPSVVGQHLEHRRQPARLNGRHERTIFERSGLAAPGSCSGAFLSHADTLHDYTMTCKVAVARVRREAVTIYEES
jgi:hypothetical protein